MHVINTNDQLANHPVGAAVIAIMCYGNRGKNSDILFRAKKKTPRRKKRRKMK